MSDLKTEFLSSNDAAAYLGVSTGQLRLSRHTGELWQGVPSPTFAKLGRAVRYLRSDLDAWLESLPRYANNAQVVAGQALVQ